MSHLEIDHPEVYQHFQNGLHVIRRSERYWAGLSTDLVIEQVLMRNMKTSGGLTRGRGMTEQQRVIWSLALPACAEVNRAMQELTGVLFNSGEQNQDMTQSRQVRDWKDTQVLLCFLHESNPFIADPSLRNINELHCTSSKNRACVTCRLRSVKQSGDGVEHLNQLEVVLVTLLDELL